MCCNVKLLIAHSDLQAKIWEADVLRLGSEIKDTECMETSVSVVVKLFEIQVWDEISVIPDEMLGGRYCCIITAFRSSYSSQDI